MSAVDPRPEAAHAARLRRLHALRGAMDRALEGFGLGDPVLVVLRAPPDALVRAMDRDAAVDLLLDLGERHGPGTLKALAARLLVHAPARRGEVLAALVERDDDLWLGPVPRPEAARDRAARARSSIAELCLARRGLGASTPPQRFAIRAHGCSLCSTWAIALSELGADLSPLTAPGAGKRRVRKIAGGAMCAACSNERDAVVALGRDEGIDEETAIAFMMPSVVLSHLDAVDARVPRKT
jgi:hypothetical protein